MHKLLTGALAAALFAVLASCATVQGVKPGAALESESGYMAIVFTNKVEAVSLGTRSVYVDLLNKDSGRSLYIPFGSSGELRLIKVTPGEYRIADFVYTVGIGRAPKIDLRVPAVIDGPPQLSETRLEGAKFPDSYRRDFAVHAGEIVYLGDYSWKDKSLSFSGPGVTIDRRVQSNDIVLDALREAHPGMPASITLVSLSD
jgi:hypothetical protein